MLFGTFSLFTLVSILDSRVASKMSSKESIRKLLKARLKALDVDTIRHDSWRVLQNVKSLDVINAHQNPCIYLSMGGEVETQPLVEYLLQEKGKIYIPKVTGPSFADMVMIPVDSLETIATFPKSKWGIPEPILPPDGVPIELYGHTDLVFVPGVAFDSSCGRLGHGKGYYDCFLDRLYKYRESLNLSPPTVVGLALNEQIIDAVPMTSTDKYLDYVITPTTIIRRNGL